MPLVNLRRGDRRRRLAVSVEPRQSRRDTSPTGRGDFVDRLERELDVDGPDVPRDPPDAGALALQPGPACRGPTTPQEYRAGLSRRRSRKSTASSRDVLRRARATRACSTMRSSSCCRTTARRSAPTTTRCCARPGRSREIWDSLWGHGTSVMSPHQYQVVLAMRAYRPREAARPAARTTTGPCRSRTCGRRSRNSRPARRRRTSTASRWCPSWRDPGARRELADAHPIHGNRLQHARDAGRPLRGSGIVNEAAVYYELDPAIGLGAVAARAGCPN